MTASLYKKRLKAALASGGTSSDTLYEWVTRLVKDHTAAGELLEYGAGTGSLIKRLVGDGYAGNITGIDILGRPENLPARIRWIQQDLNESVNLPNEFFDAIVATEVIEHLENPRASFREFYRMLRQGGVVILTTTNQESIRSMASLIIQRHFVAFVDSAYPAHITALVQKDLERICLECGFSLLSFTYSDRGGIPRMPHTSWQEASFGLLKGRLFSDNIALIARKDARMN